MAIRRPGNKGNNQNSGQNWDDPGTTLDWGTDGSGSSGSGFGGTGSGGSGRGNSGGWDIDDGTGGHRNGSLVIPVLLGCIAAVIIFGGVVLFQIIRPDDNPTSTTTQNNPSSIVNGSGTGQATTPQTNGSAIQIKTPETGSSSGNTSSTTTPGTTTTPSGNTSTAQNTPATPETNTNNGSSTTGNTGGNTTTPETTPAIVINPQGNGTAGTPGTTGTTNSEGTVLNPDSTSTTGRPTQQGTTSGNQSGNPSNSQSGNQSGTQTVSNVNSGLYRDGSNDPTGYILPESETKVLTESDMSKLTVKGICYAKNEIYARYGRKFKAAELTNYFNSKSWYSPKYEAGSNDSYIVDNLMNSYEKQNISILQNEETRLGGYSF